MAETKNASEEAAPQSGEAKVNKMECVRKALSELGKKAKPAELQTFLKEHFNLDMERELISKYKSDILIKRKRRMAKVRAGRPRKAKASAPSEAPAVAPPKAAARTRSRTEGVSLEDVQTVKDLVGRVGADKLRSLIGMLAP